MGDCALYQTAPAIPAGSFDRASLHCAVMHGLEWLTRALDQAERTAILDSAGTWTYGDLLDRSAALAATLLDGRHDLHGARVLLLLEPGLDAVVGLWATWRAGGVAVPLASVQPPAEWLYMAADSRASFAVVSESLQAAMAPVAVHAHIRVVGPAARPRATRLPDVTAERDAVLLYTSGTTGRPKGAIHTHAGLQAQIESLVEAWELRADDRLLHCLPLHHTHGLVNALLCPLWVGACCEMAPRFDPTDVWGRLAAGATTLVMAVPTMYRRLLAELDAADAATRRTWADGARQLRLAISGSAPLPVTVFDGWRRATGHALLQRYGMTETGMILSQSVRHDRGPGGVGGPLPGVDVRLEAEGGGEAPEGQPGEVFVRSAGMFRGYWDQPEATAAVLGDDGWFRTGDVAVREAGGYRVVGRRELDLIKTGGERVSALEVEECLRDHPGVDDCAVVGVPDDDWGQALCAVVVPRAGTALSIEAVREWARPRLAPWKIPKRLVVMLTLPQTPAGKVARSALAAEVAAMMAP